MFTLCGQLFLALLAGFPIHALRLQLMNARSFSCSWRADGTGELRPAILVEMPCKGTEHCDILIWVLERTMTRLAGFRQRQEVKCPHRLNEKEMPCRIATVSQV